MHAGQAKLLGADLLHFLTYDPLDFAQCAKAQWGERIVTRHQLAHVASPNKQFVGDGFRVGGIVSQRGNESAGPAHATLLTPSPSLLSTERRARGD